MGRSLPATSAGTIHPEVIDVCGKDWTVYAVGGTPAQAVLHGILEIMPQKPDLVVSGINYGENVASGITISGTVGAALEAAAQGIRSLAVSLEAGLEHHHSHSPDLDFSTAAWFAAYFARIVLQKHMPQDVDLLKVDIPAHATPNTPWQVTRLSRQNYFSPVASVRKDWDEALPIRYRFQPNLDCEPNSDVYALQVRRIISVTPLSLDMTSRVVLEDLEAHLRN
jgi:5'-nucleotidase